MINGKKKNRKDNTNLLTETNRLEAFSDGTFAIIITLLVLEIHRPIYAPGLLADELLKDWPSYLAYAVAFIYIGVIWLNHHYVFKHIQKTDMLLIWINMGILGTAALIPFPTGVLANAFRNGTLNDQRAAVVLYSLVAGLMSVTWLPLFIHLSRHPILLKSNLPKNIFASQMKRPIIGVMAYTLSGLLGWYVNPLISIFFFIIMVIFYTLTGQGLDPKMQEQGN